MFAEHEEHYKQVYENDTPPEHKVWMAGSKSHALHMRSALLCVHSADATARLQGKLSHEVVSGAAGFFAMRAYEKHLEETGKKRERGVNDA